jgi:arylesterase/paraoxonase
MELVRETGQLFIASDDRRASAAGRGTRGKIALMQLTDGGLDGSVRAVSPALPEAFHPHGISSFRDTAGKVTVMVINHPKGFMDYSDSRIEIFDAGPDGALTHRRSVSVPGLVRINDIEATGPDSFYATSESDLARGSLAESWSIIADSDRTGSVWYFDGTAGKRLVDGIGFANSLALTPDGKTLYVSGTISRAIFIYARDPATGALTRKAAAFVGTGVDNLDLDPDGRVWTAAHPKLLSFVRHAANPKKGAPSQVIVLEPDATGTAGNIDQVYLKDQNDGFSAASVAIRAGKQMVLGSVFEPGIRLCTLPPVWKQSQSHPAQRLLDTERDVKKEEAEKAAKKAAAAAP